MEKHNMDLIEVIMDIGKAADALMNKARSEAEYAFLLGHVNIAASILSAVLGDESEKTVVISLDYEKVAKEYKESKQEYKAAKSNEKQISLDDLYPELMQKLDKINKLLEKSKKNKTDKE